MNRAIGVNVLGIAASKSLRMLNRATHAYGAHQLVYSFRKRPTQQSHARGSAKRRYAGAGADDDAAAPRQPSTLARFAQMANGRVRLPGVCVGSLNDSIDARFCGSKVIERLFNGSHCLVIERIFNCEHDAVRSVAANIRPQIDRTGERSTRKPGIRRDGILQVPKQKFKIGVIGNTDIRNGLQRFWLIAARGRLHAASFPIRFRLGYTVCQPFAALS